MLIILGASELNKQIEGSKGRYYEEINHWGYNFVCQQAKTLVDWRIHCITEVVFKFLRLTLIDSTHYSWLPKTPLRQEKILIQLLVSVDFCLSHAKQLTICIL